MKKRIKEVNIGHAYPTAKGTGYRMFDGEKWVDCDKNGNRILRSRLAEGGGEG